MSQLLQKLLKYLLYFGTAVIILLAIAVGLFRLFLPRLPEYQEEIKEWANAAIGMQVEFSGMDARWRLRGPELNFYEARLGSRDNPGSVLDAEEVRVGVGLMRLLLDRELVVERILIRDSEVDVTRAADGSWSVQGISLDDLRALRSSAGRGGPLTVDGQDIRINYRDPEAERAFAVQVDSAQFRRNEMQHGLQASLVLPTFLGDAVEIAATQRLSPAASEAPWQIFVEGQDLDVAGLSRLAPDGWPHVASGMADVSLWLEASGDGVRSSTANFLVTDVVADDSAGLAAFDAEGRVEFSRGDEGWLVAADEFILSTAEGRRPETSLQLRVATGSAGEAESATGRATWINLDDLAYVAAWMPQASRNRLAELAPSGVLRDAEFGVADVRANDTDFDLSVTVDRFGIAPYRSWPGLRGFSGHLRADQSGGRLEMRAADLQVDLAGHLVEPVHLQEVDGTIVWRRNDSGTTVLSNSVRAGNADFSSVSSLQLTLPANGASAVVDLQSNWSVEDLSVVKSYLPADAVKPGLYRWLRSALVAGSVPEGSLRFSGPLDGFPFDNDEGTFRAEATLQNGTLLYSEHWPAAQNLNAEIVVENARLYSLENSAVNAGNTIV
ncbi:MAG: DUF3971 domain-containing protein, partial [Woeseia sp.]